LSLTTPTDAVRVCPVPDYARWREAIVRGGAEVAPIERVPVAEHAVMLMLAGAKRVRRYARPRSKDKAIGAVVYSMRP
jgi:lactate dehydrogenase-like 2-hydroxyacid dehydrogenase